MGAFVAIEGIDGSGKATQALELETRAVQQGYNVLHVSFPNYGDPAASFVERYLHGNYGKATEVHPELASILYAIDRASMAQKIREHLLKPRSLVVADRYVASNLAHQGTKITSKQARLAFYETILELEYKTLGIPRPDINILLVVPTHVATSHVNERVQADQHEADASYLARTNKTYKEIAGIYKDRVTTVACMEKNDTKRRRSVSDVGDDVWRIVQPLLRNRA